MPFLETIGLEVHWHKKIMWWPLLLVDGKTIKCLQIKGTSAMGIVQVGNTECPINFINLVAKLDSLDLKHWIDILLEIGIRLISSVKFTQIKINSQVWNKVEQVKARIIFKKPSKKDQAAKIQHDLLN